MFEFWLLNDNLTPYHSFGNGSAMRVSYIADYFNTEKEIVDYSVKSARCTHDHPEGIKGAVVTAMCAYMARTGATKAEIFTYVKKHYPKGLYKYSIEYKIDDYRTDYKWDVTCQGSVPVAIRCFLESDDYESFIRNVLSLDSDADTLSAIGGCVAENFYKKTGFDDKFLLKKFLPKELYDMVFTT